jgi:Fe-S-cluster-containing dehydrogenase component/DMSO reductase anchor subunit
MEKNIFTFNKNQCVGCQACVVACINENEFQPAGHWKKVYASNTSHYPNLPLYYLSLSCNHCDDAPCLLNCPAKAYYRDESTGAVLHDAAKCIGCKLCIWACPYDAPVFNPQSGIIEKCTFCSHRIEEGLKPACATLCPTGALDFTKQEFDSRHAFESSPVPVRIGSSLKVNDLEQKEGPKMDNNLFLDNPEPDKSARHVSSISAVKEWPLLVFTLLTALIVALYAHGEDGVSITEWNLLILGGGAASVIISMFHLGRKFRVWRTLMNVRHSWLSREILFFILFYASVLVDLLLFPMPKIITLIFALLLLISIDSLYTLAFWNWKIKIHSAQTLFSALSIFLLLNDSLEFLIALSIIRIALYLIRKPKYRDMKRPQVWKMCARLLFLTLAICIAIYSRHLWLAAFVLMLGEVIDRIEFYDELNLPQHYHLEHNKSPFVPNAF